MSNDLVSTCSQISQMESGTDIIFNIENFKIISNIIIQTEKELLENVQCSDIITKLDNTPNLIQDLIAVRIANKKEDILISINHSRNQTKLNVLRKQFMTFPYNFATFIKNTQTNTQTNKTSGKIFYLDKESSYLVKDRTKNYTKDEDIILKE
jgi:hypothetical protein